MARALTAKQMGFARLVAEGVPKTEALQRVYTPSQRSRRTARVAACRLSQQPKVAAEIARLVRDRFPEAIDADRVLERAVEEMYLLSLNGKATTRLKAALFLFEYAQAALPLQKGSGDKERQAGVSALGALYRKAQRIQLR
jgi:hypothetical protein